MPLTRRELLAGGAAGLTLAAGPGCRRAVRHDGRIAVRLWFSYGGKNREVLLSLVERFNASQGRYVVLGTFQGDYFEALAKLRTSLAARAAPALSHVVAEIVPYLEGAGVLEDLRSDTVLRDAPFIRPLAQAGAYTGGEGRPLVAIPFNRSIPIMYVNARLLEQEGVAVPSTWDELVLAARALCRRDGASPRWGFEVPISWWFWYALVGQAGGSILDESGQVTLGGEAGERALALWQRLVHEERVMRPPPGRDYNAWQATNQDFLAERAAIIHGSTAFMRYLEENARFPVRAAPMPRDVRSSVPSGGTFFVVLRHAPEEEKEGARAFLRFMSEPEQAIDFSTRTGYLPVTHTAVERLREQGYYDKHPNDAVALADLEHVDPWPWFKDLFFLERDVVEPRLEEAVVTRRDPRATLDEARSAAREAR